MDSNSPRCSTYKSLILWSGVSMTPLTAGGWCQWHRWPVMGGVNDTTDHWWMVSTTQPANGGRCQCHPLIKQLFQLANCSIMQIFNKKFSGQWPVVGSVNDTANHCWAVSITPQTSGGRCQWHHWRIVSGVNDTGDHWWGMSMTSASILTLLTIGTLHVRGCCFL
jgi:hypothetical protein